VAKTFKTYNQKILHVYWKKISDWWRVATFNIWQKINRKLLKTYPPIEECARCEDCGRNVHDFHVPDEVWIRVYGDESGVLCYDCFCDRTDRMGMSLKEIKKNTLFEKFKTMSIEEMATWLSVLSNHVDYEDGDYDPDIMKMLQSNLVERN
jgi:hypothetical protein